MISRTRAPVLLLVGLIAGGCAGTVRSTGAVLPVDAEEFSDGTLKVSLSYNCSGVRCDSVDTRFENLSDSPVTIRPADSRLTRAGQAALLARTGESRGPFTLAPGGSLKETWRPMAIGGSTPMSFTRPKAVWCSIKAPSSCTRTAKADAACAGFARYYYETYNSTGGWLTFSFAYESSLKKDRLVSPTPQSANISPPVLLEKTSRAPSFLSDPDDVVFYKISCDDKCDCKEASPRRNFFLDDKMRAEFN